ncbi:hypothetical protein Pmani_031204 [Petrolisthes manimaculis]|uniref:Uncharacterized protein n=1 Tax=Petrolisthes manimaculis TaxID=1843537 RepID=A0AAE1NVL4_9EUCA|nr:hypothetical protein Pmani_031204 [Petrolisthes manimaculis]
MKKKEEKKEDEKEEEEQEEEEKEKGEKEENGVDRQAGRQARSERVVTINYQRKCNNYLTMRRFAKATTKSPSSRPTCAVGKAPA